MITRRDLLVAAISVFAAASVLAVAQSAGKSKTMLHSSVFNWAELKVTPTKAGERRMVFDAATPLLEQFECHITTLNPGESPHPPHRHPEEELMIIREGSLEALQNDRTNRVEVGGIIFEASKELHGLRNIGTNRATYYVFKWLPPTPVK